MKFKSNANFNKEHKTGSIFTLKDNSLGIIIHKYVGCGDELFLNIKAPGFHSQRPPPDASSPVPPA